ncbi:hypothetical protein [Azospirillum sp. sgz302134]
MLPSIPPNIFDTAVSADHLDQFVDRQRATNAAGKAGPLDAAFEAVDLLVSPAAVRTVSREDGQGSSMKLEEEWSVALDEICKREGFGTPLELTAAVDARCVRLGLRRFRARRQPAGHERGGSRAALTGAVRVFVVTYYRIAAVHSGAMPAPQERQ